MSDIKFPIHCKDPKAEGWFYKIMSKTEALTVRIDLPQRHIAIDHKNYDGYVTHEAYDKYIQGDLEDVSEMDFFKIFTNISNLLICTSR